MVCFSPASAPWLHGGGGRGVRRWVDVACSSHGRGRLLAASAAALQCVREGTGPVVIVPGRAAALRLNGKQGSIDIVVAYFPTGAVSHQQDVLALCPRHAREQPPLPAALRAAVRRRIAKPLRSSATSLSVIMGDFNFHQSTGRTASYQK